jgi:hypothetical protein
MWIVAREDAAFEFQGCVQAMPQAPQISVSTYAGKKVPC